MPEGYVEVSDGGRLWYEVAGSGPPVVLIHAGLWDARMWDDQFGLFAERYGVVRYDLRGFGRSRWPEQPFSRRQDQLDLMRHLDVPSAALIACSAGGSLALDFALEFPERVDALVLVAAGLSGDTTPDPEEMARVYEKVEEALQAGELERAVDLELTVWAAMGTNDPIGRRIRAIARDNRRAGTLDATLSRQLEPPAAGRLAEVTVPTLVIVADQDAPVMEAIGSQLAAGIPGARKETISGADHLPNMRRPKEFNDLVLGFLGQALAAPR